MDITTNQELTNYVVMLTVVVFGVGKGIGYLQSWGVFPSKNGNGNGPLKKSGDLTVESFEGKIRHEVRNELQPFAALMSKTNEKLEAQTLVLVQIRTILEQQSK